MASTSPTGKSSPVTPSSMSSGTPPTRVAMEGNLAGHGLKSGEAEGFEFAGHQKQIGEREQFVDTLLLAEEVDALWMPRSWASHSAAERSGPSPIRSNCAGKLAHDAGKDLDHVDDALNRAEVGEVHQDGFVGRGEAAACFGALWLRP